MRDPGWHWPCASRQEQQIADPASLPSARADDFIINKYRGKSGPMFNFDVHDDVRLTHDAKVEKDEVRPFFLGP